MSDLDDELRQGLTALAPAADRADDLLPEFRRRLGRRRQRRVAGAGLVAVALLVGAVALTARDAVDEAEPVASSTTTTTTSLPVAPDIEIGPALAPGRIALPAEGVAIEVPSIGVVLVALDGSVLGHLRRFTVSDEAMNGPLVVTDYERSYSLAEGGMAELDRGIVPLSYGAELAQVDEGSPGRFAVRRDGRELFEVSNNLDGLRAVSYDRDIVTNLWDTHSEAWDLRTGRTRKHPASCWVGDRHGSREYLLCQMPTSVLVGDDHLVEPPTSGGAWERVMASPDGRRLLLQWSDGCELPEAQTVVLAPSDGGAVVKPLGDARAEALGWAPDGRFLALVHGSSACGPTTGEPGIYAVGADGAQTRIYAGTGIRAALWSPALR